MGKIIKSSVMILALAIAGSAAMYSQAPGPGPRGQWQGSRGPNPEMQTKMLTKWLKLSPDQAAQVEPILAASDDQLKALRPAEGTTPDFKALREQRRSIMEDTNAKLNGIFNQDQQAEYAKMHEHKGRGPGGPGGNWKPQGGSGAPAA